MKAIKTIILLITIVTILAGCAAPIKMDLSGYAQYQPQSTINIPALNKIEVINKSINPKPKMGGLGGDSIIILQNIEPSTKQTVENDINDYFKNKFAINNTSIESLRVTIYEAHSYWVYSAAMSIPIVGMITANSTTEFGIRLRIMFEIEINGKVVKTYNYENTINSEGKATTNKAIKLSYENLVSTYRKEFYQELDKQFIARYF